MGAFDVNDEEYMNRLNAAEAATVALHVEVKALMAYAISQRQSSVEDRKIMFRRDSVALDKVRYRLDKAIGQFGRID